MDRNLRSKILWTKNASTISCMERDAQKSNTSLILGTGHYLWWRVAPKRNVFRGKNFADPTIKKSKI
jgi:hypothetical protein